MYAKHKCVAFLVVTLLLPFSLSYSAGAATVAFKPAVIYQVGTAAQAVAFGDFNGDGKMDLAIADAGDPNVNDNGGISILLSNGDGTFQPAINIAIGKSPFVLTAGDFNGDGRADLAIIDSTGVGVVLSQGNGTFGPIKYLPTAITPVSLAVADLDGDSKQDLVVGASSLSVLQGNGDGTFQPHVDYPVSNPGGLVIADVNGDGKLDLATNVGQGIETLFGNGDGTFQPAIHCDCGTTAHVSDFGGLTAGDVNGDGRVDLAVKFLDTTDIYNLVREQALLIGNGDGTYQPSNLIQVAGGPLSSQLIADVDGDGRSDRVWSLAGSLYVLGTNATNFNLGVGSPILAVDLDGNKSPDIISVNSGNTISVFLNTTGADFSISASAPTPGTVSRGQSSTSTITLKHQNTFDDPVAFTCSVQPAQSAPTCSINPNSVTFDANGNASATLTMNTGAATASLIPLSLRYHASSLALLWLPVAGFALAGVGLGGRSSSRKRLMISALGTLLLGGLIFQSACGGGGGGPRSQTYTVTITGTSGSTQHSTNTTLTVQ